MWNEPSLHSVTSAATHHIALTAEDNAVLSPMLADLAKTYDTIEDAELARRAPVLARALPVHLQEFLEEFRLSEPSALCVISGLAVDEAQLGRTPAHWRDSQFASPALPQEIFFLLCASMLGDV